MLDNIGKSNYILKKMTQSFKGYRPSAAMVFTTNDR